MDTGQMIQELYDKVCGRIGAAKVAICESAKMPITYEELAPMWRKLERLTDEKKIYEKIMESAK